MLCFLQLPHHHLSFTSIVSRILEQLSNSSLPALDLVTLQTHFHTTPRVMLLKALHGGLLKPFSSHFLDLSLLSIQNLSLSCQSYSQNCSSLPLPPGLCPYFPLLIIHSLSLFSGIISTCSVDSVSESYLLASNLEQ